MDHEFELEDVLAQCGVRLMLMDDQGRVHWLSESLRSELARAEATTDPAPPASLSDARPDQPRRAPALLRAVEPGQTATVPWGELLYRVHATRLRSEGTALTWQSIPTDGFVARALETTARLRAGARDARFDVADAPPAAARLLSQMNAVLDDFMGGVDQLLADLDHLADCDLDFAPSVPTDGVLADIERRIQMTLGTMNAVIRQSIDFAATIADEAMSIARQNRALADRTTEQSTSLAQTAAAVEQMSVAVKRTAASAKDASDKAEAVVQRAEEGQQRVMKMSAAMNAIQASSGRIEGIVAVINEIASQTNILALNAAVEAARAGEHGRSFAVVADEVRSLATRAARAAKDVKTQLGSVSQTVGEGRGQANGVARKFELLLDEVRISASHLSEISVATREQEVGLAEINASVHRLDEINQQNCRLVEVVTAQTSALDEQTRFLKDAASVFKVSPDVASTHPMHATARLLAERGSAEVAARFERSLADQLIDLDGLFDRDYQPILDSDPTKYHSAFDALTDRLLPAVQEPILATDARLAYAGAVDDNGYFPTHNLKYSRPTTGNRQHDLVHSRTKRIFNDRVGLNAARSREPSLLQAYRRDTGALLFDVSIPIVLRGRHWGAFRIGYRL